MLRVRETERHGQNIMHWKCNRNIVFMSSLLSNTPKLNVRCSRGERSASTKNTQDIYCVFLYVRAGSTLKNIYIFCIILRVRRSFFCCSFQTQRMEIFILLSNLSNMRRKKHNFYELMKTFLSYFSQTCK